MLQANIQTEVQVKTHFLSFEEYLVTEPGELPEGRFEYCDGELIPVMAESGVNDAIANYLLILLMNSGIPFRHIRPHSCEIEVMGRPRTRLPDLVVLQDVHIPLIKRRNTVTIEMPPPQLVVEVVSPGKANRERDFVTKREQYADRGIPEYWLIDPEMECVIVLVLGDDGIYAEQGVFKGDAIVISSQFPDLKLTAAQILAAGED
jgi:Uma2 family endonuclease